MIHGFLCLTALFANGGGLPGGACTQSTTDLNVQLGLPAKDIASAEHNPSACRISFTNGRSSWCGSGAVAGFDGNGAALIMTNAHVSGSPSDSTARRMARFRLPRGGYEEFDATEIVAYAYNNQLAVDWAVLRCPTLDKAKAESIGVSATPLLKERPSTTRLEFTGSPRCVWPQTNVDITTFQQGGLPEGVVLWNPVTIGGQSGANCRAMKDGTWVSQIVLTWSWGGAGAGQETSQIYNNIVGQNADGPQRVQYKTSEVPNGLVEVMQATPDESYTLDTGYFESARIQGALGDSKEARSDAISRVKDLDIWYESGTQPTPEPTDLTAAEIEAAKELRDLGFDLSKLRDHYRSLLKPR